MLADETEVRINAVGTDTNHGDAMRLELGVQVTEPLSFDRSTGRFVLRIEVQKDPPPAQSRKARPPAIGAGEIERRCIFPYAQPVGHSSLLPG